MNCPECDTAAKQVQRARERRQYQCVKGHEFWTREVPEVLLVEVKRYPLLTLKDVAAQVKKYETGERL